MASRVSAKLSVAEIIPIQDWSRLKSGPRSELASNLLFTEAGVTREFLLTFAFFSGFRECREAGSEYRGREFPKPQPFSTCTRVDDGTLEK